MLYRSRPALLVLALLVFVASPGLAQTFVFHLRGDQEVPSSASVASGGCFGVLDQPAGEFSLTCVHDVVGATLMHIHRAPAGAIGPVVFDLGDPTSPVTATWSGMTPADVADLLAGNLYVNVHTAGRPDGEIRGQILERTVDLVAFTADGSQVMPPHATSAIATCTADLSNDATALAIACTHDLPLPQSVHVHEAPVLQNGPIVFTFPSAASPLSGTMPMTPRLVAGFAATFLYLDVHGPAGSEENPGEEIRGQIGDPPTGASTGTIRIVKASFPPGAEGFSFTDDVPGSSGSFELDDGDVQTFAAMPAGTYTVTEDNPAAAPGGFRLADVDCDDADSDGDPFARAATVRLQAGEVVTCTFRNTEGGEPGSTFVFHLAGDQEVPPVITPDRGGCMGTFNEEASELTLVCVHDIIGPTLMHVHRGAAGVNGPVAFDLGNPTSPVIATWSGMTPGDVADLLAGGLYVNVHTAGRPEGAIRGQVLERTVDLVTFAADGGQVVPPNPTPATGTCQADLNDDADELAVSCTHDLPAPDAAHLHEGERGTNGPLAFTFATAASPFAADVPMIPRLVADFAAGFLYVDVHGTGGSEDEAGDEIRGQIAAPPVVVATGTIRIVKATTPAGGAGFVFTDDVPGSSGSFALDDGQTQTFANVSPGNHTVTEADPALGGWTLSDVVCDDTDSTGNPAARAATIQLEAGEVVTCTFHNLQSVAASSIFVFHLSGDQEVPPIATAARGGCMGQLDAGAGVLSLVCTHDVDLPTVMHIHRGTAGAIGPIAFDLGDPRSPVEATWTGMTPADVADLLAGRLYVNVHASGRPEGEIRGQMLVRTVDSFAFLADGGQEVPPTGSMARGRCSADLADDARSLFVACTHQVAQPTMIHLHDAPPGREGPVVFDFPLLNPFSGNVPLTPRLVADFAAGFLYVNVHTEDSPQGEIRGQLIAGALSVVEIPTLGEWGMILFALALVAAGWLRLR
jgi:hypothetical protein